MRYANVIEKQHQIMFMSLMCRTCPYVWPPAPRFRKPKPWSVKPSNST